MTLFFKKRRQSSNENRYNPFIKIGDIIYLTSRPGRFKVVDLDEDCFKVISEPTNQKVRIISCNWHEFKRWSAR